MPEQLLPEPGKRALRQMRQVSESELPEPVPQVSVWRPMPVLQVSVKELPVPALQVSVKELPAPALQVSVSGPLPFRLHSLHWQVY